MPQAVNSDAEETRLAEDASRAANWKRWGPYLSERQWGTVREDYSADGNCWDYFTHDASRSRAYRWGEDGLLGITDRECRICFALALWNDRDPILKERLFGLTNSQGNHGEDVKEEYYYLDSTPTHSYMKALYKYPHAAFPYDKLLAENARRTKQEPEYELIDTGVFEQGRYFDVTAEYAKQDTDDLLIRITVANRGPEAAVIHLLPTLWARNSWAWGCAHEGCEAKPRIGKAGPASVKIDHATLGKMRFDVEPTKDGHQPKLLFTENETNNEKCFGAANYTPFTKDAFHRYVINGEAGAVNPANTGTKVAAYFLYEIPAGEQITVRLRLSAEGQLPPEPFGKAFDATFAARKAEADAFYDARLTEHLTPDLRNIARQSYAGLLWSKQFYYYVVDEWLHGDPEQPAPPYGHRKGRNRDWKSLFSRDVLSMPDKWEYPWFAAWDLAFHTITFARVDPDFAKGQLLLLLREWYMHPNGQLPAYEFEFSDVNPPVHAWACWRVYKMTGARGARDRAFLERAFQKLLMNFTWWVNRKDVTGKNIFGGGFLGLDNIGVFDRSKPLPTGGVLDQADGTAWMGFYCVTMLAMAIELAMDNPAYEDIASKFFEHFVAITDAMNTFGGNGLWDDADGFYYDQLYLNGQAIPLRARSLVGLIPLCAASVLEQDTIDRLPGFRKRMQWFLEHRKDLARHVAYMSDSSGDGDVERTHYLLAVPSRARLESCLKYMLDETEFLSPYGIRSLSRVHKDHPYVFRADGQEYSVGYVPGDSDTSLFGGNSNWRGPIWFPINFLLLEAMEKYYHFYGESLRVECPTGSGNFMNLQAVADELGNRLVRLFEKGPDGRRPCMGEERRYAEDPHWKDLVLFHEYFHGDTGRGVGASHQTGWTSLVARIIQGRGWKLKRANASGRMPAPAAAKPAAVGAASGR